jgi:hypothetical protein
LLESAVLWQIRQHDRVVEQALGLDVNDRAGAAASRAVFRENVGSQECGDGQGCRDAQQLRSFHSLAPWSGLKEPEQ